MTQTIQHRSSACLYKVKKDLNIVKPKLKTEESMSDLLSVFDSLHTICEELSRLDHALKKKEIELLFRQKHKDGQNET